MGESVIVALFTTATSSTPRVARGDRARRLLAVAETVASDPDRCDAIVAAYQQKADAQRGNK